MYGIWISKDIFLFLVNFCEFLDDRVCVNFYLKSNDYVFYIFSLLWLLGLYEICIVSIFIKVINDKFDL